ncbi:hypothetical protein VP01_117g9 [Puccinia sorghi]|uniref:Anaphase-promoting complex subunit 4 WD40 domain-containing protein n=1 Tax=Puccinia sorghi TaxID=27349 RepID=A0A0L6VR47_9BASI|nr:hypothetical protein VP01_117g9 [Puccinia sorghi]
MDNFGLPLQFGKIQAKVDISNKISETKRKDTPGTSGDQPGVEPKSNHDGGSVAGPSSPRSDPGSVKGDGDEPAVQLPTTHEVLLKDHSKTVSALSLDPSGARLISGSYDYACKLWDFGGMNSSFKPFRSWEPRQSHQVCHFNIASSLSLSLAPAVGSLANFGSLGMSFQVHQAIWSNTGDSFLVITAANQPQIYDRDGAQIAEYMKGDMYIRDMRHCAGHIAELTSGAWHPKDAKTFITSSADSTIRIWDVENKRKSKGVIVLKSKERGTRTKITTCTYSSDGKSIAAAGLDGTLNIWATNSNFTRPNVAVENAHVKNTETSSLQFASDNKTLVSRGGDDTVKCKSLHSHPVRLHNPDNQFILTGVSANPSEELGGRVVLLNKLNLEIFRTIAISPANVVRVLWHPKINQIITGSSDGTINVLYSPNISTRGATLSLSRTARARGPGEEDVAVDRPIITPHALAMFRNDEPVVAGGRGGKRRRERERQDPVKTLKPMPPLTGPGRGGRVGASATQHVVQGLVKDSIRHEDPREALLKFAQEHEGERPKYTAAWEETMPEPVFDQRLLEEEARQEAEKEAAAEERKRAKRERPTRL